MIFLPIMLDYKRHLRALVLLRWEAVFRQKRENIKNYKTKIKVNLEALNIPKSEGKISKNPTDFYNFVFSL